MSTRGPCLCLWRGSSRNGLQTPVADRTQAPKGCLVQALRPSPFERQVLAKPPAPLPAHPPASTPDALGLGPSPCPGPRESPWVLLVLGPACPLSQSLGPASPASRVPGLLLTLTLTARVGAPLFPVQ